MLNLRIIEEPLYRKETIWGLFRLGLLAVLGVYGLQVFLWIFILGYVAKCTQFLAKRDRKPLDFPVFRLSEFGEYARLGVWQLIPFLYLVLLVYGTFLLYHLVNYYILASYTRDIGLCRIFTILSIAPSAMAFALYLSAISFYLQINPSFQLFQAFVFPICLIYRVGFQLSMPVSLHVIMSVSLFIPLYFSPLVIPAILIMMNATTASVYHYYIDMGGVGIGEEHLPPAYDDDTEPFE
jgi:hypothetical protein